MRWAGIDFGAKLSGKTAICYERDGFLRMMLSEKGEDADIFCSQTIELMKPDIIYLDAPLSLPEAYYGKGNDFFYRQCDRELKAMSPMFLGGLTARAIRLANLWRSQNIQVFETYPKMVWEELSTTVSRVDLQQLIDIVTSYLDDYQLPMLQIQPKNYHEADSLLAWIGSFRHQTNRATIAGKADEGQIIY